MIEKMSAAFTIEEAGTEGIQNSEEFIDMAYDCLDLAELKEEEEE